MNKLASCYLLLVLLVIGCQSSPVRTEVFEGGTGDEAAPEESESRSFLTEVLLYLPNRVLDAVEMVRAGANVGPGFGVHVEATEAARAANVSRSSLGVGWQGLRHLPFAACRENYSAIGAVETGTWIGKGWYRGPADIRVELHPLLAGAHAAVDLQAILDFALGIFTLDPEGDDF